MLREGLHVIKIVAAALWMCPLMLYMCCRVNAQPWLQHGYNGPATARQAYRLVCPRAFPPNYDNPKEHEPFWLPQLGYVTTWTSPRSRPPHDVAIATQFTVERYDWQ